MITYKHLDLFSSGPSTIECGPVLDQQSILDSLSPTESDALTPGFKPRLIKQRGTLIADTPQALQALINAIDAEVDRGAETLSEDGLQTWNGCVLRNFSHAPRCRLGPRYAVAYAVTYLQTAD